MTEDDLIAAILAERDDPTPYRVYGDWLEQRGDPLGLLVALQLRNAETNLEDGALLVQEKTHFIRYPSLTPPLDQWRARYRWRWGLIDAAELETPSADELRALLSHRSCAVLRQLQLDLDPSSVTEILEALVQRTPTLESLTIRAPVDEDAATASDDFWDRVPLLRRLVLEGTRLFGEIRHPQLRELAFEGVPLTGSVWQLPALERIAWSHPGSVRSLAPLWNSELGALRQLDVDGDVESDYADEHFFAAIARLHQLSVPAEAFGETPRDALATVVQYAPRFAHLASLTVRWNFHAEEDEDEEVVAELAELGGRLRAALPKLEID